MNIKILIALLLISGCSESTTGKLAGFKKYALEKNAIVISCIKCDCIIDELNIINRKNPNLLNGYIIYIDSSCKNSLAENIRFTHTPQMAIDSISTEFYNMVIIKKKNNNYSFKEISTKQSSKIEHYLDLDSN